MKTKPMLSAKATGLAIILLLAVLSSCDKPNRKNAAADEKKIPFRNDYVRVNDVNMYYEVHGEGRPLVMLHGAYMTALGFKKLIPELSKTRKVITMDLQSHGRTADIDRPITYENLAEDVAALIRHLKLDSVDVFGYSMGGGVALQLAIRHPQLVRKMVVASASYNMDGAYKEMWDFIPTMTLEVFDGSPWKKEYDSLAPNPEDFVKLFAKLKTLDMTPYDWGAETIRSIKAPMFIIVGDADVVKPEHAVEMLRLTGGGVIGDMAGIPNSRLAIFPGTSHVGVIERTDWILSMVPEFLDAEMKKGK